MLNDAVVFGPKFKLMSNYADDMRYLLSLERLGMLDGPQKDLLGVMLLNVARSAVADMLADGKLCPLQDADFDQDIALYAVKASRQADVEKEGRTIFCYIRNAVQNGIKNRLRHDAVVARRGRHDEYQDHNATTDFYATRQGGNP